jgi:hypothetical protein
MRTLALLFAVHIVSWCCVFLVFVGFSPSLVPSYFYWGWSFSGGELPMLVWFYSWPVFAALAVVYFGSKRIFHAR